MTMSTIRITCVFVMLQLLIIFPGDAQTATTNSPSTGLPTTEDPTSGDLTTGADAITPDILTTDNPPGDGTGTPGDSTGTPGDGTGNPGDTVTSNKETAAENTTPEPTVLPTSTKPDETTVDKSTLADIVTTLPPTTTPPTTTVPMTTTVQDTTSHTITTPSGTTVTSSDATTSAMEQCDCNETFWIMVLGIGLGVPLLAFIIAIIIVATQLRRTKAKLPGGSAYLMKAAEEEPEILRKPGGETRYVKSSRARTGIESFASFISDDFDEPLYTNQRAMADDVNGTMTTTFSEKPAPPSVSNAWHESPAQFNHQDNNYGPDMDNTGGHDMDYNGGHDMDYNGGHDIDNDGGHDMDQYVNKDAVRQLLDQKPQNTPKRRIRTMDTDETYINAGAVPRDLRGYTDT